MKTTVNIKSFRNGISLHLDAAAPFDQLLAEVAAKFSEASAFFKDARMALSFEGRSLDAAEEKAIVAAISAHSDIHIVCLIGKDDDSGHDYTKALRAFGEEDDDIGHFYRGPMRGGVFESEDSIVVVGDVNPGATLVSGRDIIVLGGLYGEARAGMDGGEGHFIAALEMSPESLMIGEQTYHPRDKSNKWSIKLKVQPKIAYVKDGSFTIDTLGK